MSKVVDKIHRLLRLAQSDNPHEAALAASRARELMLAHAVGEEELRRAGGDLQAEPIGDVPMALYKGRVPGWHVALASAMAHGFMVKTYYYSGSRIHVVGRTSNREAFTATWEYVKAQIQAMADASWAALAARAGSSAQGWKSSFCYGATETVRVRLTDDQKRLDAGFEIGGENGAVVSVSTSALVLRDRNTEVQAWADANLKLRSGRTRHLSSENGFGAGKQAGHSVDLGRRSGKRLSS